MQSGLCGLEMTCAFLGSQGDHTIKTLHNVKSGSLDLDPLCT